MPVRAALVALLAIMVAVAPVQAQTCAGTPTRACVLEQALAAARAIADEGARAQALGQSSVVQVGVGRIDDGVRLAQSITDELWRDTALADIATALTKSANTAQALIAARAIADADRRAQALALIAT